MGDRRMAITTERYGQRTSSPGMESTSKALARYTTLLCESASRVLATLCGRTTLLTLDRIVPGLPTPESSSVPGPWVGMAMRTAQGLSAHILIWKRADAVAIAQRILGEEPTSTSELSNDQLDALSETANQIGGAFGTALRAELGKPVIFTTDAPLVMPETQVWDAILSEERAASLFSVAQVTLQDSAGSEAVLIVSSSLLSDIERTQPAGDDSVAKEGTVTPTSVSDQAPFVPLTPAERAASTNGIDMLLDVNLQVSVEIGRTRLQIRDILQLGPGSILELDKQAGEAVDILVNDKPIAKGEVIIIDESFGVRLTSISSVTDRIKNLR